ncbi:Transposable element Tc1 transposase, partial [Camponotus floridanus]
KFAKKPLDFWKKILWSDENKFELFGQKRRLEIYSRISWQTRIGFIQKTVKYEGGNIMVWGCFTWSGIGNLTRIESIMMAEKYIDVLCENL